MISEVLSGWFGVSGLEWGISFLGRISEELKLGWEARNEEERTTEKHQKGRRSGYDLRRNYTFESEREALALIQRLCDLRASSVLLRVILPLMSC